MTQLDLRSLVADLVREAVQEAVQEALPTAVAAATGAGSAVGAGGADAATREGPYRDYLAPREDRSRAETVAIGDDADLMRFARHLLSLYENPKNRQDLRAGRLTFRLQGGRSGGTGRGPAVAGPARLVERGAVTERQVTEAADNGERLVLGPRAVLTPLGRERARALGVTIEKERAC